jgi:hypothetical protein
MTKQIKVEITIPLRYNDGSPIETVRIDKIKRELVREFGGLSISGEIEGYWTKDNVTYCDFNKIFTVVCDDTEQNISWLTGYKFWLKQLLDQKDIFIVVSEVKTL